MQSQLKIYKASAGSGKTYTLAKSYVKILIANPSHYKNILAITFTKKATAEMKNRILLFLQDIKENNPKQQKLIQEIIHEVQQEYGKDVSQTIHEQAHEAIQYILHDYSHFQVTTIDSFFQLIIRSFAKELKLPIGMNVELDSESVLDICVQSLLESYEYADENVAKWLEQYIYSNIENDKGWNIEKQIATLGKEIFKEEYMLLQNDIENIRAIDFEQYRKVATQQQTIIDNYKKYLKQNADEATAIIEKNNIDTNLFSGNKTISSYIQKAKNASLENFVTVQKMLDGEKSLFSKETMKQYPAEVDRITTIWHNELYEVLNNILNYHLKHIKAYNTAKSILKNIYAMALLDELSKRLSEYRNQENIVLISDAPYFISKIANEEATPFIYEKISTFINYILIDEFQDTSALQWRSLLPIVIEILSRGNGLSLIVGDAKQSIYRWRGGKMELILHHINQDLDAYKTLKEEIVLGNNHRSCPNIIAFNNEVFNQIAKDYQTLPLLKDAYNKHQQCAIKNTNDGYVQYQWIDKAVEDENVYILLTNQLRQLHQRYHWKDIAILVRRNSEALQLANYFQENAMDIPFVSGESLLIANHLSVQLLIATLEYILFHKNNFYAYKLENIFCQYFEIGNRTDALIKKEIFCFQSYFDDRQIAILSLKENTLLDAILHLLHFYQIDQQSNIYVLRLIDEVHQYIQKNSNHIIGFLQYWQEKKNKITILPSEDTDAIQIMTIHKSKGLEFPVVMMPFVDWSLLPKSDSIFWTENKAYEIDNTAIPLSYVKALDDSDFSDAYQYESQVTIVDNINNLYVAFTRAEKELYLYSKAKKEDIKPKDNNVEIKNVCDLMYHSLKKIDNLKEYFVDAHTYQFGTPPMNKKNEMSFSEETFSFANILINNNYTLSASSYSDENTIRGEIIHELMMYMHDDKKIENRLIYLQQKYQLDEPTCHKYKKMYDDIKHLLSNHQMLDVSYKYYYEKDFVHNQNLLRADVAIETPQKIVVIDYKTGFEDAKHHVQLQQYQKAYAQIFNKPVDAYLLYTDSMLLKPITQ